MSHYLLNQAWNREKERLESIQALHDPITIRHLEALGVDKGWHCAEVGAGVGSIATWLSERIGDSGQVVATDIDTRFLVALSRANLDVRSQDVVTEPLEAGAYDLVHARMLLMHLPEREQVIEQLVAALRPGGYLLVEDADFRNHQVCSPPSGLLTRTGTALVRLLQRGGADPSYGLKLLPALVSLGLTNIGIEGQQIVVPGGTEPCAAFTLLLEQLSDKLIEAGLLSWEEIEGAIQELRHPSSPVVIYGPIMISVWGQRSGG